MELSQAMLVATCLVFVLHVQMQHALPIAALNRSMHQPVNININIENEDCNLLGDALRELKNEIFNVSLALSSTNQLVHGVRVNTSAIDQKLLITTNELGQLKNESVTKETSLNSTIFREKEKVVKELEIAKSAITQKLNDLGQLIYEGRANASSANKLLKEGIERLDAELVLREKSLKDIVIREVESLRQEMKNASTPKPKKVKSFALAIDPSTKRMVEATWSEARSYCLTRNMTLISIDSYEDSLAFINFIGEKELYHFRYWTDGIRLASTLGKRPEDFFWSSTEIGVPAHQSWLDIRLDNTGGTERCLEVANWQQGYQKEKVLVLNDLNCMMRFRFVCQTYN